MLSSWRTACSNRREPSGKNSVSYKLNASYMKFLIPFRRCILLLLSVTLSMQVMAAASFGACHRVKALIEVHQADAPPPHHHDDSTAHHDGSMHHADSSDKAPAGDNTRVSCASCAACHLFSVIANGVNVTTALPVAGAASFPDTEVARARNVASGLERPPRA